MIYFKPFNFIKIQSFRVLQSSITLINYSLLCSVISENNWIIKFITIITHKG